MDISRGIIPSSLLRLIDPYLNQPQTVYHILKELYHFSFNLAVTILPEGGGGGGGGGHISSVS